jgi:hypothetical protein
MARSPVSRRALSFAIASLLLVPVAAAAPTATLTFQFTNRGEPLPDPENARFYVYEVEKRDDYLAWGHGAKPARVPEGVYDVVVRYTNDQVVEEREFDELELSGEVLQEVDFDFETARLTVQIDSGGQPIPMHAGQYSLYRAGQRGEPLVSRRPGESVTTRPGSYDVEVTYRDHKGLQRQWLERYYLEGERFEQVDFGPPAALLRLTLLERGGPLGPGRGRFRVFAAGRRDEPLAEAESGDDVELPAGLYDVELIYRQGRDYVERWLEGLSLQGEVVREIDIDAARVPLRIEVRREGRLLEGAWFSVHPVGDERTVVASGMSGTRVEVEPGIYDIGSFYRDRGVEARTWLRSQSVNGAFERTVELNYRPATVRILPRGRSREPANVLLVLDSSAGMGEELNGRTKLELTALSIKAAVGALRGSDGTLGLRAFGVTPASRQDCRDSALLLPPGKLDPSRLASTLDLLRPGGMAAIAYSMDLVAADLPVGGRNYVVVITGNVDGCGRDPCESATRTLRGSRVQRLYTVGVGIPRNRQRQLSCAGEFYAVSGRSQLRATLQQIFRDVDEGDRGAVSLFRAGGGEWVTSGTLGDTLDVAAGTYDVVIHSGGRTYNWRDVEVDGAFESEAGNRPARDTRASR